MFNAPFSNTRSVVELALAEIIALTRRLTEKNARMHAGVWDKSADGQPRGPRPQRSASSATATSAPSCRCSPRTSACRCTSTTPPTSSRWATPRRCATLDELLEPSDVVTLHVDGRPGNSGLFGEEQFARMRPGSLFLNLCRGFVVDHAALRRHIESGHLAGAAVDVFPDEPKGRGDEFSSELRGLPNVILTPHIGGSTEEAQPDIGAFVAGKLRRVRRRRHHDAERQPAAGRRCRTSPARTASRTLHHNMPGVLAAINGMLAEHGVNIEGQLLGTGEVGYVLTDIGTDYPDVLGRAARHAADDPAAACCPDRSCQGRPGPAAYPRAVPDAADLPLIGAAALRARAAARVLRTLPTDTKDAALHAIADALVARADGDRRGERRGPRGRARPAPPSRSIDRLRSTPAGRGHRRRVRDVAGLPDPVGEVVRGSTLPNGLELRQVRVPLGVVGIIYEARPNVTVDAAALCLKSGNAVLLRGSSSAYGSNAALVAVLRDALAGAGLPADAVQLVAGEEPRVGQRADARPRPGRRADPARRRRADPHGRRGVDGAGDRDRRRQLPRLRRRAADLDDGGGIVLNAKTQRPSVCNAAETLLVHADVADAFLPRALAALAEAGVTVHGDDARSRGGARPPWCRPPRRTGTPSTCRSTSRRGWSTR